MNPKVPAFLVALMFVIGCLTHAAVGKVIQRQNFRYQESVSLTGLAEPPTEPLSLWYQKPATHWEEALPIGNGRLAAMVYGGVGKEICLLYTSDAADE